LGGSRFKTSQANIEIIPISKKTRPKQTGGMTQAVECLLCKHEAMNTNSKSPKKKKTGQNHKNQPF
jgi:hypothetical protein